MSTDGRLAEVARILGQYSRGGVTDRVRAVRDARQLLAGLSGAEKRELAVAVANRAAPDLVERIVATTGEDFTDGQVGALLDMARRLDADQLADLVVALEAPADPEPEPVAAPEPAATPVGPTGAPTRATATVAHGADPDGPSPSHQPLERAAQAAALSLPLVTAGAEEPSVVPVGRPEEPPRSAHQTAPPATAPPGVAPSALAPSELAPSELAPSESAPSALAPSGLAPSAGAPSGKAQSGIAQSGLAPSMNTPDEPAAEAYGEPGDRLIGAAVVADTRPAVVVAGRPVAGMVAAIAAAETPMARLVALREGLRGATALDDPAAVVRAFPPGWSRRRAALALAERGLVADAVDAVLEAVSTPHDRRWVRRAIAHANRATLTD